MYLKVTIAKQFKGSDAGTCGQQMLKGTPRYDCTQQPKQIPVCFENCLSPKRGQVLFYSKTLLGAQAAPCWSPSLWGALQALCSLHWAKVVNKHGPGLFWRIHLGLIYPGDCFTQGRKITSGEIITKGYCSSVVWSLPSLNCKYLKS